MNKAWRNFRTSLIYWRFRYITRNRLRFRSWISRRNAPQMVIVPRPRATASYVHQHSVRRTWALLIGMTLILTALKVLASEVYIFPSLVYAVGALVVVGAVYSAVRAT